MWPDCSFLPKLQTKAKHYTARGEAYMASDYVKPLEVKQAPFF